MARLRTSGALVLLVGLLSALGCRHSASGTEAEHGADLVVLVHTASVERQTVRELVETAGTVGPSLGAEAQVAAQVTGTVVNVLKDEGEEVAASEAVLLHGSRGYSNGYPVERYFRDIKGYQIYEGTSHIQRIIIARALLNQTT